MQQIHSTSLALALLMLLARQALAVDLSYFGDAGPGIGGTCCTWVGEVSPAGLSACPVEMLAEHPTCHVITVDEWWGWRHFQHDLAIMRRSTTSPINFYLQRIPLDLR